MQTVVEELTQEAERQLRDQAWIPAAADRVIAERAAAELHAAVGAPQAPQVLSDVDRLARLREALAALAIALAHVHGRLAWFLGAAATALAPILHWRALPSGDGPTFGAVQPTPEQYTEAEEAIRKLHAILTHIATT
ncbi:hypothetical protein [Streptomyces hydrogenans]|uniref:hypothetical protein n=1 Tax=Streptomyces hydrogenans TaxID=1873719 RepID=UPI00382E14AB